MTTCVHNEELEKEVLDEVAKRFPKHQVANLYLFGSRLHNCARPDSDFDLMMLLTGPYFVGGQLVPISRAEVNIYHAEYFIDLLKQQVVWLIFIPYYPKEAKWIETINLQDHIKGPEYYAFGKLLRRDFDFKWRKALYLWQTKPKTSKKIIAHMIRYSKLAVDLFKVDHMDFAQTNDLFEEIVTCEETDWEYYISKYKPIIDATLREYDSLYDIISSFINVEQDLLFPLGKSPQYDKKLAVLEFIKLHGVNNLLKHLSVTVTRHPKFPELLQLTSDEFNSPSHIFAVEECEGLILKEKKTEGDKLEYEVVCYPYKAERTYKTGRISNMRVCPYKDGWRVMMYWYGDAWHLCTRNSIDASVGAKEVLRYRYNPWRIWSKSVREAKMLEQYYNIEVEGTVADRFWTAWKKLDLKLPTNKELSYIFDLTIAETTRFKVPGREYSDSITFLGAQHIKSLVDFLPVVLEDASEWPHIDDLPLVRMSDVLEHVRSLDPCESRGVIVIDLDSGLRYKLISKKSSLLAKFIFTAQARDKEILETILYNDKNDACQAETLQHLRPQFEKLLDVLSKSVSRIEKELENCKQLDNRDMARRVRRIASGEIIMMCRNKGMTVHEVLHKMNSTTAMRGLKELFKNEGVDLDNVEDPVLRAEDDDDPDEPSEKDSDTVLDEYNMM
jgi:hypothetical protein